MIRIPLSRHTLTPSSLFVSTDTAAPHAVHLTVVSYPACELTSGEARYLAEALIDAAGRVEAAAS